MLYIRDPFDFVAAYIMGPQLRWSEILYDVQTKAFLFVSNLLRTQNARRLKFWNFRTEDRLVRYTYKGKS